MLNNVIQIMKNIILKKLWKAFISYSKKLYRSQWHNMLGKIITITIFVVCITFYFTTYRTWSLKQQMSLEEANRIVLSRLEENVRLEKGSGCVMPQLDPFSEVARSYNKELPPIVCPGTDWVQCHKSECYVVTEILKTMKNVVCYYRDIIYINDKKSVIGERVVVTGDQKYILNATDHVKVSCTGKDTNSIFLDRWYGYKTGLRLMQPPPTPPSGVSNFNVLMLCYDSTSHNGFMRKMPKSFKYLSKKAVILNSYNVVGDGTPAALFPLLTGKAESEHPDARKSISNDVYIDHNTFIFHLLKGYGYRTAFFEDMPQIGTFQYRFNGFRKQPADHYLRAFFENSCRSYHENHCIGAIPIYQLMMNISNQFLELDENKYCFTFISHISHDNFNVISTTDDYLVSWLQDLVAKGTLENTLVMVFGDHGTRFSGVRNTYQGKLEERLPLMAIMLPEKLKRIRPDAVTSLEHNRDVLTTPFDIYATVLDVLDLKHKISTFKISGSDLPRAMSLMEPIPSSRSCAEAGVMLHWCACTKWHNVSQSNPMYKRVAGQLAEYIDSIGREQASKCAERTLTSIEWVLQQNVNEEALKYGFKSDLDTFIGNPSASMPRGEEEHYQAKIKMSPGGSVFEGTIIYHTRADAFVVNQNDISRVNAYGNEPSCISATHPHLNKYCYCKDKTSKLNYWQNK